MRVTPRRYVHVAVQMLALTVLFLSGCNAWCAPAVNSCTKDDDCGSGLICELGVCIDPCYVTCAPGSHDICMPNPASVYCHRMGGTSRSETNEHGQISICILPDGTEREHWELYCTDCPHVNYCGWWPVTSPGD